MLTKAATAPFALLGRLFGGGEQMNLVDFEPGSTELDALASARAHAIEAVLVTGGIDAARVFVVAPGVHTAAGGKVRIEMGLR